MADVLTSLFGAVAGRLATVPGIRSAYYPAPNSIEHADLPVAIVYSGSPNGESAIVRNTGGSAIWEPAVLIQLLGERVGNTPQEFAAIDALIVPVVDAFETTVSVTVNGVPQHIDRTFVTGYRGTMQVQYAAHAHYAAEFYLSIKFRRARGA